MLLYINDWRTNDAREDDASNLKNLYNNNNNTVLL